MHAESLKKINAKFSMIQCSFMMSFSAIVGFSVVLLKSRNFNSSEIGIILAVECVASVFSQTFLGNFADKHKKIPLKWILLVIIVLSFIINTVLMFIPSEFFITMFIFVMIGMTEYSATGLINALAIQFVNRGIPVNFGLARGLGSLAYAVGGFFIGKVVTAKGPESILVIHAVFLIIMIISICIFDKPDSIPGIANTHKEHHEKNDSVWRMLAANKKLLYFLTAMILTFISHGMLANFLPQIVEHVGGNSGDYGTAMSLAALSEIPTMVCFSFFMKKTTSGKLVMLSFLFFFVKSVLFIFSNNIYFIFAFQMLQILGYGLFVPASVYYVNEIVAENEKIRGQSLVTVASMGIGITIGNLLGGWILDLQGVPVMLIVSTVFSFLGFVIVFLSIGKKKTA
ncbi:MFS transporter [Sebaldella sp. S0638]|uniref:MFS transporter n=1 Tax=Sebaldella sp. S0638 TaxID=2957809 RepID=UPI00209CA59D|nr:MFS transporter [Sebaldella sp. S0638]MCP1224034.1 MFS transporter [Sebaldella sp. S0638]